MKKIWITLVVVTAIIALLALPKLGLIGRKSTPTAAGPTGPRALPVEALIVKPQRLDNKLVVTGSILPNESLELRAEATGKINQLRFQEGKPVKKGDLLVQIDDEEILAQLQKQRYNKKLNEDVEYRQRKLLERDAISQEEYDNALNRLRTTEADISLLESQLEKTRIRAPFDGLIGLRYVSQGAYLTPATVVATLYSINPAKIEFAVPGRYSTEVKAGLRIRFTVENDTSKRFEGVVYALEPRIDPETRTLRIRAQADNLQGLLIPGQFVKIDLILNTTSQALLVPTEAVIPEQGGKKVFLYRSGKAQEIRIESGIRTASHLEVVAGLQPGDTVLTTGMLQLRGGMEVQVTKFRN